MQKKAGNDGDVRSDGAALDAPDSDAVALSAPEPDAAQPDASEPDATGAAGGPFAPVSRPADDDADLPPASPLAVFEPEESRRRWPRIVLTTLGIAVVLGGAYVGASWALGDRVPRGATVAGVEIGGQDATAAAAALTAGLADVVSEPIPVAAGDNSTTIVPADAGLTLDAQATVDGLTGFDLQPVRLWNHIVGLGDTPPVTVVDTPKLTAAIEAVSGSLLTPAVDGAIVFADGAAHATEAADGAAVEPAGAADVLRTTWLTGDRPLVLPTEVVAPDITQEETDVALSTVAEPLAQAPISVAVADQTVELPVAVVTSLASFAPAESGLVLSIDGPRLVEEVISRTTNLLAPSSDASFAFVDGTPTIVPGVPGTTLDPAALADAVAAAGVGTDRTARVELVPSDPAQSTAKLEALGIKEIVSEFSTPLTREPVRTQNLAVGAEKITGTLVLPGETFSLTDALGPITVAAGFREAGVIVEGEHVQGMGGGLSQMSTTTFNAAYFAGFEDVAHTPHSEWFSRYPEGRESTLYTGSIDMKFKNTSPSGALIRSWIADGRLHVAIWGTKYWTVESSTSGRSGVVRPTTVHSSSPTCEPQSAGNPGFSVTVTRTLSLNGAVAETTQKTTRYKPQNAIVCDPPAAVAPPVG